MDALVIGSGPNGLTAAAHLARAGWSVLVLEAQDVPGGACRSVASTRPGFTHDLGAAFFPFAAISPGLTSLDLGVRWRNAPIDSAHPGPDGACPSLSRDLDEVMRSFGDDGEAMRGLVRWFLGCRDALVPALLATPLPLRAAFDIGLDNLLTFASLALPSPRSLVESRFRTEAARRVIPALGLHADIGPDDLAGSSVGLMLALLACDNGFPVAEGGAGAITRALVRTVEAAGGQVRCGERVTSIVARAGRAVAVRTSQGHEIEATRAIVADVAAPTLFQRLLAPDLTPAFVRRAMARFPHGWGTFKVDWALDGPVPWIAERARRAAVVHLGDSVADLARFTAQMRAGQIPSHPYLVLGQQSIADPSRAPAGCHTLDGYTHVPSFVDGGWPAHRERVADAIEARIEALAPGFRQKILARRILDPQGLEAHDENLLGGDIAGGTAAVTHQFLMRPVFPYFRYRMPLAGLYLASAYAHPGPGVHGACGYNAALAALADA